MQDLLIAIDGGEGLREKRDLRNSPFVCWGSKAILGKSSQENKTLTDSRTNLGSSPTRCFGLFKSDFLPGAASWAAL